MVDNFNLNDATILKCNYDKGSQILQLSLEVSNCLQPNYKDGDPDFSLGTYTFTSATFSENVLELMKIINSSENYDVSILSFSTQKNKNLFVTTFKVCIEDYLRHQCDYCTATITSSSYQWKFLQEY